MGLQGGLQAMVNMSGAISETGGGGSEVEYTAVVQSGTKIGILTIDDVNYNIYTPPAGDSVEFTAIQQSGTKIGTITINDTPYDIYAPTGGGGGGSEVSFTQVLGSGTKIGTITIDDTPTDIYAPTPPDAVSYTEVQQSGTKIGTITIGSTSTDIYAPTPVTTLRGLSDVELNPYITTGNVLMFNGSKWGDSVLPIRTFPIGSLTDVDITSVSNGQILKYNSTSEKWENANESGGGGGGIDYSTTEQDTGIDWIDGRSIYQKTYSLTNVGQGVVLLDSSFTTSLYDIVWHESICWKYSGNIDLGNHGGTGGPIYLECITTGLYAVNSSGVDISNLYFTIRYTKTADIQ